MSDGNYQRDLEEILKAKKAADEKARAEAEKQRQAFEAHQNAEAAARNAAQIRWPEFKRELDKACATYNTEGAALGISLAVVEDETIRSWLPAFRFIVTGHYRSVSSVFTIGQTNKIGYQLIEQTPPGHRSVVPADFPHKGELRDLGGLIKMLVANLVAAQRH